LESGRLSGIIFALICRMC